jgi:hypothetical protein
VHDPGTGLHKWRPGVTLARRRRHNRAPARERQTTNGRQRVGRKGVPACPLGALATARRAILECLEALPGGKVDEGGACRGCLLKGACEHERFNRPPLFPSEALVRLSDALRGALQGSSMLAWTRGIDGG